MKRNISLYFSLLAPLCFVIPAYGQNCECPNKADVKTALHQASIVFVGQADKVGRNPMKPGEAEVRISVQRKFKGFEEVTANTIILYTPDNKQCGYEFRVGLDYLVYATGTPAHFMVDKCTRTEILDNVLEEVQQLGALTRAAGTKGTDLPRTEGR